MGARHVIDGATGGVPISYEVFPGATCEGHSLVPVLQDMQRRHQVERTVCVADRGMLGADNLDAMDRIGGQYVVGARLRTLPRARCSARFSTRPATPRWRDQRAAGSVNGNTGAAA